MALTEAERAAMTETIIKAMQYLACDDPQWSHDEDGLRAWVREVLMTGKPLPLMTDDELREQHEQALNYGPDPDDEEHPGAS